MVLMECGKLDYDSVFDTHCLNGAGAESRDRGINLSAIYGARIYAAKALDAATRDTLLPGNSICCFPASPARGRGQGENPLAGLGGAQVTTRYSPASYEIAISQNFLRLRA